MARQARVVVPGLPHHITQRGNRRQVTFFGEGDYIAYLQLAAEAFGEAGVEVWAYCLMPNHVHIIATPPDAGALAQAVGPPTCATRGEPICASAGRDICGRGASLLSRWTRPIFWPAPAMWA